jgi:precorrin-6Y C5,15-methyltransferase (decarboxylating)
MLAQAVPPGGWRCLPQVSCLSLACARLGWAQQEAEIISFCGRPVAALRALLQPGRRVLALSEDDTTPAVVARLLDEGGFGTSDIVVLEALGGPRERITHHLAAGFDAPEIDRLNMMAITLRARPSERALPRMPGLPDGAFLHDGQLTKREIRAATLAALAPLPGQMLWDIGTGSGSIAIEWMRAHPANRAVAFDRRADRLARARANAQALGVPGLRCVEGSAPEVLAGMTSPDAIFIGGGAQHADTIGIAWTALASGGRIVVNAVTIETEAALFKARENFGGSLTRIGVERLVDVGRMHGYRPAMTITQWAACKP